MTIGERIKRLRLESGMTQEEVGKELGITKAAVQKYENDQIKNFRVEMIRKMCILFRTTPAYFVFDDVEELHNSLDTEKLRRIIITHFGERFVQFLDVLDTLNEDGRKKVMEYTNDLSQIDHYKRDKYKKRKERLI